MFHSAFALYITKATRIFFTFSNVDRFTDQKTKPRKKGKKREQDRGTDNLPAFFSLLPLCPNSWRVSGLPWKTILIIWKCGSSSSHCVQCVLAHFLLKAPLTWGLLLCFQRTVRLLWVITQAPQNTTSVTPSLTHNVEFSDLDSVQNLEGAMF